MRALAFVVVVLLAATTATAEPRTHDGLYVRVGVGAGYPIATLTPAQGAESGGSGPGVNTARAT